MMSFAARAVLIGNATLVRVLCVCVCVCGGGGGGVQVVRWSHNISMVAVKQNVECSNPTS